MKYHPDRCPDDPAAQDKFKEAKEAYEVLADGQKRAMYDQHGHAAFEDGMGVVVAAPVSATWATSSATFSATSSVAAVAGAGVPRRGADLRYIMELDLEEAVFGVERTDRDSHSGQLPPLQRQRVRRWQDRASARPAMATVGCACRTASSRSSRPARIAAAAGRRSRSPASHVTARADWRKRASFRCGFPAGVDNGDRIRLTGQGEAGPAGAESGDLYVEVSVREHAIFQREGNDLHCEVPIRFSQAALGVELPVPTLEGEVPITIPPETQTGQQFRLRGRGVKSVRSGRQGDLICRVVVETPVRLTSEQRELFEQLEATFGGSDAEKHTPRAKSWVDGVKQFWSRVTA